MSKNYKIVYESVNGAISPPKFEGIASRIWSENELDLALSCCKKLNYDHVAEQIFMLGCYIVVEVSDEKIGNSPFPTTK